MADVKPIHRVDVEAIEDRRRWRDARLLVIDRSDPSVYDRRCRRLAEVVAHRAQHHGDLLRPIEIVDTQARLVDDHERVDPHVAFGVPFGLLRAANQRLDLGKQLIEHSQTRARARTRSTASAPGGEVFRFLPRSVRTEGRRAGSVCTARACPDRARTESERRTGSPAARAGCPLERSGRRRPSAPRRVRSSRPP